MTEERPESPGPWRWPAAWLRDQAFWKDVSSRSLATLIAGGLAYLFALGAGYISKPGTGELLRGIIVALVPVLLGVAVCLSLSLLVNKFPKRTRTILYVPTVAVALFVVYVGYSLLLR